MGRVSNDPACSPAGPGVEQVRVGPNDLVHSALVLGSGGSNQTGWEEVVVRMDGLDDG